MKSAIRMAVVVLMASASTGALAGDYGSSKDPTQSDTATTIKNDTDDQDAGHGSGEPGAMTSADGEAREKAALAAYNHQQFVEQSWMGTP